MNWRTIKQRNDELLIDNILHREYNEDLIDDLHDLNRYFRNHEREKDQAVGDKVNALLMLEDKDREMGRQQFAHNTQVDTMAFDIKARQQLIVQLNSRLSDERDLNKLQNRRIMELEEELIRWKAKYDADLSAQNSEIKRLRILLDDQNIRNDITSQTLLSFTVPKFEEERRLRTQLLMAEKEILRLKEELKKYKNQRPGEEDDILKHDNYVQNYIEKEVIKRMDNLPEIDGSLKKENLLLKKELTGLQRSKDLLLYEMEGLSKDEEINRLRRILLAYQRKEAKTYPTYSKRDDDPGFRGKYMLVHLMNRRFDRDLMQYLFKIWRFKYLLKTTIRMKSTNMAINFRDESGRNNKDKFELIERQKTLLFLWNKMRSALATRIFDIFLRSKNQGAQKKSYILFKINMEEFIGNDDKLLLILLMVFVEMTKALGEKIPRNDRIRKLRKLEDLKDKEPKFDIDDYKEINPYGIYDAEVRDTINEWIEAQIVEVHRRRKVAGKNKVQKEMVTLFRYNAIYYKCLYPYSNKQAYRVDQDLFEYLESLICRTLNRLVGLFEEKPPTIDQDDDY